MYILYMDNFFTSCPLVKQLAEDKIFVAGAIKERAAGFPDSLKGLELSKGHVTMQVRELVIHAMLLKTEKEFVL